MRVREAWVVKFFSCKILIQKWARCVVVTCPKHPSELSCPYRVLCPQVHFVTDSEFLRQWRQRRRLALAPLEQQQRPLLRRSRAHCSSSSTFVGGVRVTDEEQSGSEWTQRVMGGRGTDDDDTQVTHTDTNKLTRHTASLAATHPELAHTITQGHVPPVAPPSTHGAKGTWFVELPQMF